MIDESVGIEVDVEIEVFENVFCWCIVFILIVVVRDFFIVNWFVVVVVFFLLSFVEVEFFEG